MEKKTRTLALVVVLVFATATANAALTLNLSDNNVGLGETVTIEVYSSQGGQNDPYDYGAYVGVPGAATSASIGAPVGMYAAAGPAASYTQITGYENGHEYQAKKQGGSKPTVGYWSYVTFSSSSAGTYTINLYDYTTNGGDYTTPGTPEATADIVVTPEPATVALLGLGGLLVLIRRR